nr:MAG TPA: hypothetical protein [Caudoviricetes sp.]
MSPTVCRASVLPAHGGQQPFWRTECRRTEP